MARTFPLMRGGGALLVLVGLGLVVGGLGGRHWFLPGLITGLLGLLCILNAGLGLLVPGIPYRLLWITDGVLKIAAGSSMVWLSY